MPDTASWCCATPNARPEKANDGDLVLDLNSASSFDFNFKYKYYREKLMIIIAKYILCNIEMVDIKKRGRKEKRARKIYKQLKYECYRYTILNTFPQGYM